ncbi:uncharacterized protein LOC110250452 [Exaiptasia diaphana]|uniref:Sel1 repeat family protein n=1 Tax=Exaiptasia diaphana TaxID=2652724 RepID=A0A913Y0Q8_EXADI|nr:uncharacterized protein LOC110250452 [Exaiptasia diaphana]
MALAYCYGHGDGVNESQEKSFEYHQLAANKGHPAAQYNVGVHYFAGKGVTLDMSKAAESFQASAEQGFELAQINLGNMYYNGLGLNKDLHKARDWYRKAAERNPNAKALLEEVESELGETDNLKPT